MENIDQHQNIARARDCMGFCPNLLYVTTENKTVEAEYKNFFFEKFEQYLNPILCKHNRDNYLPVVTNKTLIIYISFYHV